MSQKEISIRPCNKSDAGAYLKWRTGSVGLKYNPVLPLTLEQAEERLLKSQPNLENLEKQKRHIWIAQLNSESVGSISVHNVNDMMKTTELGYFVDQEFHSQGIATRAVGLVIDLLFHETFLRKVYATVHIDHVASRRVLEKLGFQLEGVMREHFIVNDKPVDEAFYGLLRKEWSSSS